MLNKISFANIKNTFTMHSSLIFQMRVQIYPITTVNCTDNKIKHAKKKIYKIKNHAHKNN